MTDLFSFVDTTAPTTVTCLSLAQQKALLAQARSGYLSSGTHQGTRKSLQKRGYIKRAAWDAPPELTEMGLQAYAWIKEYGLYSPVPDVSSSSCQAVYDWLVEQRDRVLGSYEGTASSHPGNRYFLHKYDLPTVAVGCGFKLSSVRTALTKLFLAGKLSERTDYRGKVYSVRISREEMERCDALDQMKRDQRKRVVVALDAAGVRWKGEHELFETDTLQISVAELAKLLKV